MDASDIIWSEYAAALWTFQTAMENALAALEAESRQESEEPENGFEQLTLF